MPLTVDSKTYLRLGAEIAKRLDAALKSFGDPPHDAFGHAGEIVNAALEGSDPEMRSQNAAVIIEFLQGEMTKLGLPTSSEAMAILAEKSRVDAQNAETGRSTDDAIFRETFIAHFVQSDFPREPEEEDEFTSKSARLREEAVRRFGTAEELMAEARQRAEPHSSV